MKIPVAGFRGAALAPHPKLLNEELGVDSRNQKAGRGDFRPWAIPLNVATIPAGRSTIYRMGRDTPSDATYWLSFVNFVSLARSQVSGDTTERTYYTGDGVPKWTDNTIALASPPYPAAYRTLGVPVPTGKPTLAVLAAGTAEEQETLYYVYTFVTDKGEESAPSPVSNPIHVNTDATITIGNIDVAPSGSFTVNRIRIYRTQSSDTSATAFFFLREITAGTTTTTDDRRALGEVIPTVGWLPPPTDLSYLTPMWNGMMAAISGGAVRYCPAYVPYAWPIEYETPPPNSKAVALGVFGQSLLVLTTAKPMLVAGSGPDSLDAAPLEFGEACVAPRSVVSFGSGVAWACPDGLAWYGAGGARILTQGSGADPGIFTRKQWQAMNPAGMVAAIYEGHYFCSYTDSVGTRRAFMIDPGNPAGVLFLDVGYDAMFFDEIQDALYVLPVGGTAIQKWDAGASFMTAKFVSKVFPTPPVNLGFARVVADVFPCTLWIDAGPFDSATLTKLVARSPSRLSAVGTMLRYTVTVANASAFRLPDGFLASEWQVTLQAATPVQALVLADSARETVA